MWYLLPLSQKSFLLHWSWTEGRYFKPQFPPPVNCQLSHITLIPHGTPHHSTVPCPLRCSMGVSHCWRTASQWPQSSRDTALGVSLHPQWDSTTAAQILWQHAKEKGHDEQSPSEGQDEVLEWSRKEKPLDKQQQRERNRSETTELQ